ncbi:MAG: M20/M25/M40 family metallo-hydrolase, partial [Synergistales bacterium]|nr:M20/M25/M40 family metallo-hydrolase [Synergistales bacterium]
VAGFTPDAEYPLINGEKGIIIAGIAAPFRPGEGVQVESLQGGVAANSVPDTAEAVVCLPEGWEGRLRHTVESWRGPEGAKLAAEELGEGRSRLHMQGVPSHGSRPGQGVNAIAQLVRVLRTLGVEGEQRRALDGLDRLVGTEHHGESLGVCRYDDSSGYTSVCMGMARMEEGELQVSINPRFPVSHSTAEMVPILERSAGEAGFSIDFRRVDEPLYVPEDAELVRKLLAAYRTETGRTDDRPMCIGGGTYAKAMPGILAFGPLMPGEPSNMHEADECWSVESMVTSTRIMAGAIAALAGGNGREA